MHSQTAAPSPGGMNAGVELEQLAVVQSAPKHLTNWH